MANESSKKCMVDCTNEAIEVAENIKNFFLFASFRKWCGVHDPDKFEYDVEFDKRWGYSALGILDWFRRRNYDDRPEEGVWTGSNQQIAFDWFMLTRVDHIAMFGITAGNWHELVLFASHRIVFSTWKALGGFSGRFGEHTGPKGDWMKEVNNDELQLAIQNLCFRGEWGGRPRQDSDWLIDRLGEEYNRANMIVLNHTIDYDAPLDDERTPGEEPPGRKKQRFRGANCPKCGKRAYVESTPGETRRLKCRNPDCLHRFKKTGTN